jgi:hypothetical protein
MSFRGQASWAKMTIPRVKLTAQACHLTKKVNKAEKELALSLYTLYLAYYGYSSNGRLPLVLLVDIRQGCLTVPNTIIDICKSQF